MDASLSKRKQEINNLIDEGNIFLSSETKPLEKRAELIAKVYKASSTYVPLFKLGLKLLDIEESNEPKLDGYLSQKKLDCSHLRKRWSTQLEICDRSKSLDERFAVLEEEYALYVQSPEKVEFFGKVIAASAKKLLKKEYSELEQIVSTLDSNPICYTLEGNQVTLTIPKSKDKMDRAVAAIVNCFIGAYDLSQEIPLEQTRLLVDFGKIVNRDEKFSFHLKYSPHLEENRKLLKDRGVFVSECSTTEIFRKAVEIAKPQIDLLIKKRTNGTPVKGLVDYMDTYLEASRYLLMISPGAINLPELKTVLRSWKPSNNQWVTIPQHYAYAVFEAARHEPDKADKTDLLNGCIESAFLSLRERENGSRASYAPMYALLARIKKYAEEADIEVNIDSYLNGLGSDVQNKISSAVRKDEVFEALSRGDFLQAVIVDLGDLSDLEKRCISMKGKSVFVPIDELGVPAYGLVVKMGGEKVKKEFRENKLVYDTLKEANGSKGVPFPRPLELRKVGNRYLYFMERSAGLSLSQKFRHWKDQYARLEQWEGESIEEWRKKEYTKGRQRIKEREVKEVELALTNLARFHGQLSRKCEEGTLSTEVRVKDETGTETCETFKPNLDLFDYLENLVERAFVKSKDPKESKERVKDLVNIIGGESKLAFDQLDKRDYFKFRIPYSEGVYDFLVEYNKFIQQNLPNPKINVVLHGDVHLNNGLEGGTIIDNKPLRVGHPFVDIAHFLEHPSLNVLKRERKYFVRFYYEELKKYTSLDSRLSKDQYQYHSIHNCICLAGAMLDQGEYFEAEHYLETALKTMYFAKLSTLESKFLGMLSSINNDCFNKVRSDYTNWKREQTNNRSFSPVNRKSNNQQVDEFWDWFEQLKQDSEARDKIVIGIDFDGVITNSNEMKIDYARDKYGLHMTENDCSLEKAVEIEMTKEQYQQMARDLYGTERCMEMKPVPQAIETIFALKEAGFKLYIVTSRIEEEAEWAKKWLQKNKLSDIEVINTNDQPKLDACREKGISIFIDDSCDKLASLTKAGIAGYLFTTHPNKDCKIPDGARRMDRWDEIYTIVNYHKELIKAEQSAAPRSDQTPC